jgi:DNA modification methylase
MKSYEQFLEEKTIVYKDNGFEVLENEINPIAKLHQNATIRYALRKGKAAIFHDTGLGKTLDQLEIGRLVSKRTNKPFLLVMPLWVAYQTIDDAKRLLDMDLPFAKDKMSVAPGPGVYVTNYEILHKFEGLDLGGISFDESSIFKGDGKFFERAKRIAKNVLYVFCASATPSPNSTEEMGRQAEVLGIMTVAEMKATFFVNRQDKKKTDLSKGVKQKKNLAQIPFTELVRSDVKNKKKNRQGWELRPHATEKFYKWLASWAMAVKLPSDIGFSDEGYILPKLTVTPIFIDAGYTPKDQLVFTGLGGVSDRSQVRKLTLKPKCEMAVELIGDSVDQWTIWCGLNSEANLMKKMLDDKIINSFSSEEFAQIEKPDLKRILNAKSINVQGSDKLNKKIDDLRSFVQGETQILITKTKICGHGSNFQNCHKVIYVGLSDSWESFYQSLKRFHRFMQTENVEVYIILAHEEMEIWENVQRKGREAEMMTQRLIENAKEFQREELDMKADKKEVYVKDEVKTDQYHIMLGDAVDWLKEIKSNSVGLSVYSPPFEDLFVYSNSERDLGNSATKEDFYKHYEYICREILRATMPGRKTVVHVADIHARKNKDGFLGLIPFSDRVTKLYIECGWHYQGRIPIAKNPQATAIRLKAHELMFATMKRDASRLMPVQPDYLLVFSKEGKNKEPILPMENGEMNEDVWIKWAGNTWLNGLFEKLNSSSDRAEIENAAKEITRDIVKHYLQGQPIWQDIKETEVLRHKGKGGTRLNENDTKHICPLQLEPVERVIKLWSNPGDTVLDPFLGSGTTVYQSVKLNRFGKGIELKPEYFYDLAVKNIEEAVRLSKQEDLFSMVGIEM